MRVIDRKGEFHTLKTKISSGKEEESGHEKITFDRQNAVIDWRPRHDGLRRCKVYTVRLYDDINTASTLNTAGGAAPGGSSIRGGLVTTTVTVKDTGERKQIFGYTARRIITTMETESSPDACSQTKSKMVQDGWYIDDAFQLVCDLNNG